MKLNSFTLFSKAHNSKNKLGVKANKLRQ